MQSGCAPHLARYDCADEFLQGAKILYMVIFLTVIVSCSILVCAYVYWALNRYARTKWTNFCSVITSTVIGELIACLYYGLMYDMRYPSVAVGILFSLNCIFIIGGIFYLILTILEIVKVKELAAYAGLRRYSLPFWVAMVTWSLAVFSSTLAAAIDYSTYYIAWRICMFTFAIFVFSGSLIMVVYCIETIKRIRAMPGNKSIKNYIIFLCILTPVGISGSVAELVYCASPDLVDSTPWLWYLIWVILGSASALPGLAIAAWAVIQVAQLRPSPVVSIKSSSDGTNDTSLQV
jgi:hypothetical protein